MNASLFQRMLIAPLPWIPESFVWRLSQRYIAGVDLDSACRTVSDLNSANCRATVDVLGEDSTTKEEVDTARDLYLESIDAIERKQLDCNISVKLSDMGLRLDNEYCYRTMETIVGKAAGQNNFVRIDMEDATVTGATLDLYRRLRAQFDNVGTVIQSCLRRSDDDVQSLLNDGIAHLRLCKGIYVEPEDIAFTDADEIRDAYKRLLEQMFSGGAHKVAIATHDPELIRHALATVNRLNIDKSRYEFQMLLGVAGTMRAKLVAAGHPLRVYVPFGVRWYAYSIRRLRENPTIATHIVRNLFTRK